MKIFRCKHCGNIIVKIEDSGVPVVCCGEEMELLVAESIEASYEKHIPVVSTNGDEITVKVGSEEHPMITEHYIEWILVERDKSFTVKYLQPGEKPEATFYVKDEKLVNVFAYCNLHGLWKN